MLKHNSQIYSLEDVRALPQPNETVVFPGL